MTISSNLNKKIYIGNGLTKIFDYDFDVLDENDLEIYLANSNTGIVTQLTTNYSVSPTEGSFPSSSGTVTYPLIGVAISNTYIFIILRSMDIAQPTVYPNNTSLKPKVVEKSFDRITMISQQIQEQINRCVKTSIAGSSDIDLDLLGQYADQAILSASKALISEINAEESEEQSALSAASAATSAANAFASTAPAWSIGTTYNYPTVVAYTDGDSYRCIGTNIVGEYPDASINWVRITINMSDFFDIDVDGGLMPALSPTYSSSFELDTDGGIMPK
jgi:hypothetical protein